jgi:hypothetical protein
VKSVLRLSFFLTIFFIAIGAPAQAQELLESQGIIDNFSPSERYEIDLQIGDIVTITTEVISGNLDTTLALLDPTGRTIAVNDDRGDGTYNSQITHTAVRRGTFVIVVSRYDSSTSGEYRITVVYGAPAAQPAAQTSTSGGAADTLEATGRIDNRTPAETYTLDLVRGQTVTITTQATSGNLDTTLALYDPNGTEVASNDDITRGNLNSQIIYVAQMDGTYTVEVSRYDNTSSGDYRIEVAISAASGQPVAQTGGVEVETLEAEGSLDDTYQSESYEIDLDRGERITITTQATSGNLDTVLFLYDPNGDQVATNDDIERGNLNSQIVYTALVGGTFTIEVTRYDETSRGDYRITVDIERVTTTSTGQTTPVTDEEQVFSGEGVINNANPRETWELPLEAGSIVVIDVFKTAGNLDTTVTLLAPNGQSVAFNDDRGDGTFNSRITYEVPTSGTYTIVVERYDSSTSGDYDIVVTIDPNATPDFSFVNVEGNILAQGTGTINRQSDVFRYEVPLTVGQSIYASVEATSGDLDTILSLFAPSGRLVAINDDRGDGTLNSALAYTAETTGTYVFSVSRYDGSPSSGSFAFVVQEVEAQVVQQIEDTSTQPVSLSGPTEIVETEHFRIHYTLAGTDATSRDYVRSFAETLEEMYDLQINRIGWAAPPAGSDGLYSVFITDVIGTESGALAYARPISFIGDNPNSPLVERNSAEGILVVDNDYIFPGQSASPQTLLRASTTHEFNHLVQFGYDADEPLFWIFEATAVWTETVTVGDEQDATGYIGRNHEYPELCFATEEFDGVLAYGDWTLLEVLADRYGEGIVIRLWENAIAYDGLEIITRTLQEAGTTLPEMVALWRARNLVMDYDLGALFPRPVWLENTINSFGEWSFQGDGIQELGANYYSLSVSGAVSLALNGPNTLDVWVVGIQGERADAFQLGRGGTVDLSGYGSSYAMVVSNEVPRNLNNCRYQDYSLSVARAGGATLSAPTATLGARFYQPLRPR